MPLDCCVSGTLLKAHYRHCSGLNIMQNHGRHCVMQATGAQVDHGKWPSCSDLTELRAWKIATERATFGVVEPCPRVQVIVDEWRNQIRDRTP